MEGQHGHAVGGEIHQCGAVVAQQRVIERIDEALALLFAGRAPMLAQHQAGGVFAVEIRQQDGGDEVVELGRILAIGRAVGIQLLQHLLRRRLDQFLRAGGGGRRRIRRGSIEGQGRARPAQQQG